jgi:hypothetical protein
MGSWHGHKRAGAIGKNDGIRFTQWLLGVFNLYFEACMAFSKMLKGWSL